jgi:hypothetical protein
MPAFGFIHKGSGARLIIHKSLRLRFWPCGSGRIDQVSESVGVVDRQDHAAVLAELAACVDRLLSLDVAAQDSRELCSSLSEISAQIGRLQHHLGARAAELNTRKVPAELGFRGTSQFLQATLRCTSRAARDLAFAVEWFGPRTNLTGQQLEPHFPFVASALSAGAISSEHAKVVADAVCALPEPVRLRHWSDVETALVELARTRDPLSVKLLARRIAGHLDPDGPAPNDETDRRAASRRRLFLNRVGDSSGELGAVLTPACHAIWEAVLTPLAAKPAKDALGEDTRTDAQRWHDAFERAGRLLLGSGKLPENAGAATTLVVTVELRDLERRVGRATTHRGGTLSIGEVLRIATAGAIVPVILGDCGEVLDYGRRRRLASPGQRRALFARDRGCTFPDCTQSAARSEIHHTTEWTHGGQTNVSTMAIACGYHNNEAPRQGWKTLMIKGVPHWQPPSWRDPERRPLRNLMHHPELLTLPSADHDPPPPEEQPSASTDDPSTDASQEEGEQSSSAAGSGQCAPTDHQPASDSGSARLARPDESSASWRSRRE